MPGRGFILTLFRCSAVVFFISDVSACCAAVFLLVVLCFRLGGVRADCVPSELAATFLSLRSIYLTPNPNPGMGLIPTRFQCSAVVSFISAAST